MSSSMSRFFSRAQVTNSPNKIWPFPSLKRKENYIICWFIKYWIEYWWSRHDEYDGDYNDSCKSNYVWYIYIPRLWCIHIYDHITTIWWQIQQTMMWLPVHFRELGSHIVNGTDPLNMMNNEHPSNQNHQSHNNDQNQPHKLFIWFEGALNFFFNWNTLPVMILFTMAAFSVIYLILNLLSC